MIGPSRLAKSTRLLIPAWLLALCLTGCCSSAPSSGWLDVGGPGQLGTGSAMIEAPATASDPLRFELALLRSKQGPPLENPELRIGQYVILGGFVRGLTPSPAGRSDFALTFHVQVGDQRLHPFHSRLKNPLDDPATGSLRLDLGVPLPPTVQPGPATFHLEVEEPGRPPVVQDFPFIVLPAAERPTAESLPGSGQPGP